LIILAQELTISNGGNGNGIKIIPQKELTKYITKVPITTENWQDYMELEDYETVNKDAFGDIQFISKGTRLKLKNNNIYTTGVLEFEITNPDLMNPYADKTISICEFRGDSLLPINNIWISKEQEPDTTILDGRFTINDIKCTRTKGYIYIFNIPDNICELLFDNRINEYYKYFRLENPDNNIDGYYTYFLNDYSDYISEDPNRLPRYVRFLGQAIENGTYKDINL